MNQWFEDTLSRGRLCVLAGRRSRLHLLCVGKLREKTRFEILPALILLPTVDEHFILQDDKENSDVMMQAGADLHTFCGHKGHGFHFMNKTKLYC